MNDDPVTEKPLRADARRNRDRIVEVAAVVFARDGAAASLDEIAREAGVGIGTLYRHFGTREVLYVAVHRTDIAQIAARADELLATQPPLEALVLWVEEFLDFLQAKQGDMAEVFRAVMADGKNPFLDLRARTHDAATRLLDAAGLSEAIDTDDLLVALHGISLGTGDQKQARRIARVLLAGLRH